MVIERGVGNENQAANLHVTENSAGGGDDDDKKDGPWCRVQAERRIMQSLSEVMLIFPTGLVI